MIAAVEHVAVVVMVRQRVEARNDHVENAALAQACRQLAEHGEWIRHVLEHVVQHDQVEAPVRRNLVHAPMPQERDVARRLEPVRIPAEILQRVEQLSLTAAEVQDSGARRRREYRQVGIQGPQQQLAAPSDRPHFARLVLRQPPRVLQRQPLDARRPLARPVAVGRIEGFDVLAIRHRIDE
jgi:hypothetical protein